MPFSLGAHRWLRLLVAAAALYLVFLPIWWVTLDAIAWVAAAAADFIYHIFDSQVSIAAEAKAIRVVVAIPEEFVSPEKSYQLSLRVDSVTYGLPMLAALITVTRAESWRAKLRALAGGLGLLLLLTVPVVMLWAKLASLQLEQRIAQATGFSSGDRSSFIYYVFHGYAFSQPALAVGIWLALLMLGLFKAKAGAPAGAAEVKEEGGALKTPLNKACPCGSGRKYKRCCGRARGTKHPA